jgi:hypothetical protein
MIVAIRAFRSRTLRSRSTAKRKAAARHSHSWGVMLIRKRGQFLGYVEAPDRAAAELADEQRHRPFGWSQAAGCI